MEERIRTAGKTFMAWLMQEKHKAKAKELRDELERAFTEHPHQTDETYLEHLWFTVKMSLRFAYVSSVIMLHGLFPFIFVRTASLQIEKIYLIMKSRIPKKRREEIDREHGYGPANPTIAIIGGGFSGTLTLCNLIRQSDGNVNVEWFDELGSFGPGTAYDTRDVKHLLNVRADKMGAFAGKPEGFFEWLQKTHPTFKNDDFVPRMFYGDYLRETLEQCLVEASAKNIRVRQHTVSLTDAERRENRLLLSAGGKQFAADALLLATGNLPPRNFGLAANRADYVENVWQPHAVFPARAGELSSDANIVIIGTGLTMADTVLTLKARGFKGRITAISRNGLLPASHAAAQPYPAWGWVDIPKFAPRTARGLLRGLRTEIMRAENTGHDWRSVIDSLRPVTQTLWQQLGEPERARFMRKLATLWNTHRHRMAPEIHRELEGLQQSGQLSILKASIDALKSDDKGIAITLRQRGKNAPETLRPALVINCTGPECSIVKTKHVLLKKLLERGLVAPGPLGLGVASQENSPVFAIGNLQIGELLECTAVPDLRELASQTASRILTYLNAQPKQESRELLCLGEWI